MKQECQYPPGEYYFFPLFRWGKGTGEDEARREVLPMFLWK